jgi:GABA(A) receptor-associated protein
MSYIFNNNSYRSYSSEKSLEERQIESDKVMKRFPERIPIIVEPAIKDIMEIDKKKYMVSKEMTLGQFIFIVRKRLKVDSSTALFFTVGGELMTGCLDLGSIYDKNKNEDNFLYIKYTTENTFG